MVPGEITGTRPQNYEGDRTVPYKNKIIEKLHMLQTTEVVRIILIIN